MRPMLLALLFSTACGGGATVSSMQLALAPGSGLAPGDVGSVEILVLGGARPTCARALAPASPLDDPELEVVRHALFTVDGTAKHLTGIPAGEPLVFYAEAFQSPDGKRPRVGRGCAAATLAAGKSAGVSITLTKSDD